MKDQKYEKYSGCLAIKRNCSSSQKNIRYIRLIFDTYHVYLKKNKLIKKKLAVISIYRSKVRVTPYERSHSNARNQFRRAGCNTSLTIKEILMKGFSDALVTFPISTFHKNFIKNTSNCWKVVGNDKHRMFGARSDIGFVFSESRREN